MTALSLLIKANRIKRDSLALAADTLHAADSSSAFSQNAKTHAGSKELPQKLQAEKDSLARLDSLKRESNARFLRPKRIRLILFVKR